MLTQDGNHYHGFNDPNFGFSADEAKIIRQQMVVEGLITKQDTRHGKVSILTHTGFRIARSEGGYKGVKLKEQIALEQQRLAQQEQWLREQEQLSLNRVSTNAAVSSAKWARISGWIAAGSLLVAIIAAVIAWQANTTSNSTEERLRVLEAKSKSSGTHPRETPAP
ncbi:hypothetical protein [Hymenobacter sp. B81]|uniref:hypothetical protein n=1 Tax=Hymenobacter sp. B81 TaxID=3344878 RepID=UPI0037DD19CE